MFSLVFQAAIQYQFFWIVSEDRPGMDSKLVTFLWESRPPWVANSGRVVRFDKSSFRVQGRRRRSHSLSPASELHYATRPESGDGWSIAGRTTKEIRLKERIPTLCGQRK